jgi:hypothetical protein
MAEDAAASGNRKDPQQIKKPVGEATLTGFCYSGGSIGPYHSAKAISSRRLIASVPTQ